MRKLFIGSALIFSLIFVAIYFLKDYSNPNLPSKQSGESLEIDSLIAAAIDTSYQLGNQQWEYTKAIDLLSEVLNKPSFKLAQDSSKANLYHRIGAYQQNLKQNSAGKKNITKAIDIRTKLQNISNKTLSNSYYIRALTNDFINTTEEGLDDIKEAIRLIENEPNNQLLKEKYFTHAAKFYLYLGDLKSAEYHIDPFEKKFINNEITPTHQSVIYLEILSDFYSANKKPEDALKAIKKAEGIHQQLGLIHAQIETRQSFVVALYGQGKFNEALSVAKKSLELIETNKNKSDIDLTDTKHYVLNNLGALSLIVKKYDDANKYYQQMAESVKEEYPTYGVLLGQAYEGLGDVAKEEHKFVKAIENYHSAIKAITIGLNSNNEFTTPSIQSHQLLSYTELQRILGFKIEAIEAEFKKNKAIVTLEHLYQHYITLDSVNFHIRQSFDSGSARFNFVEKILPTYEKAIQTALELYEVKKDKQYLEEAYHFAAKNKAIVMLDGVQNENAKFAGLPKALLQDELALKKEYYAIESDLYDEQQKGNPQSIEAIKEKRFEVIRKYGQMIELFEKKYPKYYDLKFAHRKNVTSGELAGQLDNDQAIIEYFIGQEKIHIFSITKKDGLQYYSKQKPNDFTDICQNFMKLNEKSSEASIADFASQGNKLYQLLLEQPLAMLQKNQSITRLKFIPDGELLQFSFDGLFYKSISNNAKWSSTDLPYLLKKYAISYAYSNQLIFDKEKTKSVKSALKPYAGFGLEYTDSLTLSGFNKLTKLDVDTVLKRGMGKLLYSDDEVKEIATITGGKAFVNDVALKSRFWTESRNTRVIHLAMHGFVVKEEPLNSGLIFKRQHANDEDYILKAGDLYAHNLEAELAVLSACHTGVGAIKKGEGVRSLARAFNYAGCPTVVASLWSAPDYSTKDIMVNFFKLLKEGKTKDVALQEAKLMFFENAPDAFTHPNFWTHLIAIGDDGILNL